MPDQLLNVAISTPRSIHLLQIFRLLLYFLMTLSPLFQKDGSSQTGHHTPWLHKQHKLTCMYPCTTWHGVSEDSLVQLCRSIIWFCTIGQNKSAALCFHSSLFAGIPGSDYINANYIDGYRKQNAYIATQGALPETFGDFWRMMWEQRGATVVMMTKLEERSRVRKVYHMQQNTMLIIMYSSNCLYKIFVSFMYACLPSVYA